jgi:hypothetical protein
MELSFNSKIMEQINILVTNKILAVMVNNNLIVNSFSIKFFKRRIVVNKNLVDLKNRLKIKYSKKLLIIWLEN